MRCYCPPDTWFEIWALVVWGRAHYLSVTEALHNIKSSRVSGEETFCFFETWMPEWGLNPPSPTFQAGSLNHCARGPRPSFSHCCHKLPYITIMMVNYICYCGTHSRHKTLNQRCRRCSSIEQRFGIAGRPTICLFCHGCRKVESHSVVSRPYSKTDEMYLLFSWYYKLNVFFLKLQFTSFWYTCIHGI